MAHLRTILFVATLVTAMLAGCTGDVGDGHTDDLEVEDPCLGGTAAATAGSPTEGFCGQEAIITEDLRDLRVDLTAEDTLAAPKWQVGDVFEQHMFFGKEDTAGSHIQTMVVDTAGDCYTVATNDLAAARFEVTYDYPILGCIGKQSISTSAFGTDWSWMYEFPLKDGKSWTATIEELINWNTFSFRTFDVTFTAEYDAAIDTPKGDFPGFWITGTTAEGERLLYYNYVPAVGWFSHFWIYDLDSDDPDDVMFHSMSMGTWKGYTGGYYLNTATTLIDKFSGAWVDPADPTSVADANTLPTPVQFDAPAEAHQMIGVVVPIAAMGRTEVVLSDPDNEVQQYKHEHTEEGAPAFGVHFVNQPVKAGTWTTQTMGASPFFWGSYVWLMAVTDVMYELAEADLPAKEA